MPSKRRKSFFHHHSLSLVTAFVLCTWITLYIRFNPSTHWGAFFGNAIADWTGLFVTVVATKYFFEIGSAESRVPPDHLLTPGRRCLGRPLVDHLSGSHRRWVDLAVRQM